MHDAKIGDPIVTENYFSVCLAIDIIFRVDGRNNFEEMSLYEVYMKYKLRSYNFFNRFKTLLWLKQETLKKNPKLHYGIWDLRLDIYYS